jgi:hypothetical protein
MQSFCKNELLSGRGAYLSLLKENYDSEKYKKHLVITELVSACNRLFSFNEKK